MIDTSSVNFAINKLSEGWQKVAPTIQDVGEKYVQYVVTQQVVSAAMCILTFASLAGFAAYCIRKAKESDEIMNGLEVGVVFSVLFCALAGAGALLEGRDAVLAITNPEMFAIHEILRAAK